MTFLFYVAVGLILLFITIIVICFFGSIKISSKFLLILLTFYVLSLTLLAFHIKPQIDWDLYRHYNLISYWRNEGTEAFLASKMYLAVPASRNLFYLVSKLPSNQFLPAIAVFVEYTLFCSILYQLYKSKKLSMDLLAVSIFAQLAFCPIIYSFSGIRNTLACSILAYAVFTECTKKKKIISVLLYLLALAIHSSVVIIVVIRLLVSLKKLRLFCIIIFLWPIAQGALYSILIAVPNEFINTLGSQLFKYTEEIYDLTVANVVAICVCVIPFAVCTCCSYWNAYKKRQFPVERQNEHKLFLLLLLFSVSSCLFPHITVRMMYQMSFLLPLSIAFIVSNIPRKLKSLMYLTVLSGMSFCFVYYIRLDIQFYTASELALTFI